MFLILRLNYFAVSILGTYDKKNTNTTVKLRTSLSFNFKLKYEHHGLKPVYCNVNMIWW